MPTRTAIFGRLTRLLALWPVSGPAPVPRPRVRSSRQSAARALRAGAVFTLLLHAALGVVGELSLWVRDPGYADKEVRLTRAEVAAPPAAPKVVMLGTSRTGFAFHGTRIEAALAADLGRPAVAFNFGIPASGPVTHAVYLKRLLEAGHRPDLMLIEVLPASLADLDGGPMEQVFLPGDRLQWHEVNAVAGYDFKADKTRAAWAKTVALPWYALRFPILGRLAPSALPWQCRFDWSRTVDPRGWMTPLVDTVTDEQRDAGLERSAKEYGALLGGLKPGGGPGRALRDALTMCRDHGIPAAVVLMPESPRFRVLCPDHANERLTAFLRGVCRDAGCALVDARGWLPEEAFTDGHHMLRPGAEAFSDRLTRDVIAPALRARPTP